MEGLIEPLRTKLQEYSEPKSELYPTSSNPQKFGKSWTPLEAHLAGPRRPPLFQQWGEGRWPGYHRIRCHKLQPRIT
jgi:hypothetical protein